MSAVAILCVLLQAEPAPRTGGADAPTVGMLAEIRGRVLPGTELVVLPLEDPRAPIVLRVAVARPHGTAIRYDLVYYGLEPGTYDLRDYLRRRDGSSAADLPPIPVTILPSYPVGDRRTVNELQTGSGLSLGGYRTMLAVLGALWIAGLGVLVLAGRKRRSAAHGPGARTPSLADRLAPLVRRASEGAISEEEQAVLERLLLAFWRRRLHLEGRPPVEGLQELRNHEQAGPLVRALEGWLHRPGGDPGLDLEALLRPYRDLPTDLSEDPKAV